MSYEHILTHHGIKGQEWGERNGPPYPLNKKEHDKVIKKAQKEIKKTRKKASKGRREQSLNEEHVIPAGTKLYRTTITKDEDLSGHKYVSYVDEDRNFYRDGSIAILQARSYDPEGKKITRYESYENEYALKTDLKIPSRKKLFEVGAELLSKDEKFRNDVIEQNLLRCCGEIFETNDNPRTYKELKKWANDHGYKSFDDDYMKIRKSLVDAMFNKPIDELYGYVAGCYASRNGVRNKVFDTLKKEGYNAIMDEEDIKYRPNKRGSVAPMIIFDGSESLERVNQVEITRDDEWRYHKKYRDWTQKQKGKWSDSEENHILG